MPDSCYHVHVPPRERGVVLIVALIFLVVITLLGITAMSTNTLEERMAANTQELNRSFQAAETGLAVAFSDGTFVTGASDYVEASITSIGSYGASVVYFASYLQTVDAGAQRTGDTSLLYSQAGADTTTTSKVYYRFGANSSTAGGVTSSVGAGGYKLGPGQ